MWLEATACASRKPGKPAVALLTASTAAPARTRPGRGRRDRVGARDGARPCARGVEPLRRWHGRGGRAPAARDGRSPIVRRIAPPRKTGVAPQAKLVGRDRADLLGHAELDAAPRSPRRAIRAATRSWRRRASAPPGTRRRRPSRSHHSPIPRTPRSDARHDLERGARRPPGRGGSAGRPRASTRSRRSARSGRGPQVRPRARRRRRRARATSAATPSRARGTRRRRRPRPRSCRPRAAPSPRSARPPRATSRSACAVCRAPASSFSRRRHPAPPSRRESERRPAILHARGGGSSAGRAPGCGPGGRGFESRPPPSRLPSRYPAP